MAASWLKISPTGHWSALYSVGRWVCAILSLPTRSQLATSSGSIAEALESVLRLTDDNDTVCRLR